MLAAVIGFPFKRKFICVLEKYNREELNGRVTETWSFELSIFIYQPYGGKIFQFSELHINLRR